jgi:DNA-binding NtrC family response regulator
LENLIERAVILSKPHRPVEARELFPGMGLPVGAGVDKQGQIAESGAASFDCEALLGQLQSSGEGLEGLERALLREAVSQASGNLSAAARMLGLTRPQLSYRLSRDQDKGGDPS